MDTQDKIVKMSKEEAAEFEKFKAQQAKKQEAERRKQERETYRNLVDETIDACFPSLQDLSMQLAIEKLNVFESFSQALEIKAGIFNVKSDQRSHAFTNTAGDKRIILGQYEIDGYDDTVNEGIGKVKAFISSLARDANSEMLVKQVLRLLAKDQKGNLKASRVMQLRKMAEESGNETFIEGINIIEESYRPQVSKLFVRAEFKTKDGAWENVPLGITEA